MDWHHQDFYGLNPVYELVPDIEPAEIVPAKPVHFDKMKEIAFKLSAGLTFSRIDLYDTNDGPLFGEITLYPASGIGISVRGKELCPIKLERCMRMVLTHLV